MLTQDLTPKNFWLKNFKSANKKSITLPYTNELQKISHSNQKKECLKKKYDKKNSILALKNNAIGDKKKQNNQGDKKCYDC